MNIILEIEDLGKLKMNNMDKKMMINNHSHLINHLDENKKKNFKNRFLISVFVVIFYLIIFVLSFLADKSLSDWINPNFIKYELRGIFAFAFCIVLYIPFFFCVRESLRLVFLRHEKIPIYLMHLFSSLLYMLPSILLIVRTYYVNEPDTDVKEKISLIVLYLIYWSIFFCSIIIVILSVVFLKKYNRLNFQNGFTIPFLTILVSLGFMGFAITGLMSGWTTILFLSISIAGTDVFCYLSGLLFGKHKMAKNISPNKTWEGAILGTILTIGVLLVYSSLLLLDNSKISITHDEQQYDLDRSTFLLWNIIQFQTQSTDPTNPQLWIILFFIASFMVVVSILGDLLFSYIKRKYQIKDFGTTLKSHGGFLDRFDSFIVNSFCYFFYTFTALGIYAMSRNLNILFGPTSF